MLLPGKNDVKESRHICIPVPIMAWTNFPSGHRRLILFLTLDYRDTTTKGRVCVGYSSLISRLMDQFFFYR